MRDRDVSNIIAENKRRLEELCAPYDQIRGIGSPIERFAFMLLRDEIVNLPVSMLSVKAIRDAHEAGGLPKYLTKHNLSKNNVFIKSFMSKYRKARYRHDFEYWAIKCVKVQDKITKSHIPFVLRFSQRLLLKELETLRLSDTPIRIALLKARQWGGSTLVQIYMSWIQLFHKFNWHSAIVADVDDQARNIRSMYNRVLREHPKKIVQDRYGEDLEKIILQPHEGSQKNRVMEGRGCVVGIGSSQKPDNFRSYDFAMLHASEVGLWKETQGRSPEDLMQALRATVPNTGYSLVVLESTAKGVGNFFHREWQAASEGKSGYKPVFVPWFKIPELYTMPISDYQSFINNMSDRAWELWHHGATLEGIAWYVYTKEADNYDDWRMCSEFPTTATEAFQSTGRRAFAPVYVLNARKNCIKPIAIGDLHADSRSGPEALKNINFEENSRGFMRVYSFPDNQPIKHRYALFVDIGGRHHLSDYSVIKVFDRYWMMEAGVPETAAVWSGHLDQDLVAWKAVQIGTWFNNGLVAIETNSLRKDTRSSEGDHFLTILDEVVKYYKNLYMRSNPDKIRQGVPQLYGFHTNSKTKVMLIDGLNAALRDEQYIERDARSCDEMDTYEHKPDGSYGAVEGAKDDHVIVTAGGLWLCLSHMPMPTFIKVHVPKPIQTTKSEAMF